MYRNRRRTRKRKLCRIFGMGSELNAGVLWHTFFSQLLALGAIFVYHLGLLYTIRTGCARRQRDLSTLESRTIYDRVSLVAKDYKCHKYFA
jgi:hypothetical protein